jgi:hypothetical protein
MPRGDQALSCDENGDAVSASRAHARCTSGEHHLAVAAAAKVQLALGLKKHLLAIVLG